MYDTCVAELDEEECGAPATMIVPWHRQGFTISLSVCEVHGRALTLPTCEAEDSAYGSPFPCGDPAELIVDSPTPGGSMAMCAYHAKETLP